MALMRELRERGLNSDELILLRLDSLNDAVQHWQGTYRRAAAEVNRLSVALDVAQARLSAAQAVGEVSDVLPAVAWLRRDPAASAGGSSKAPSPQAAPPSPPSA